MESITNLQPSPMQPVNINGFQILIKRDDLINPYFSGNKARKLACFLEGDYSDVRQVISFGSVQSNFLYSLSALAKLKNWQFKFYVQRIPDWLIAKPIGNYAGALGLGANIIEVDAENLVEGNLEDFVSKKFSQLSNDTLLIPEGGRTQQAEVGIIQLAKEIENYCKENNLADPIIMLPSGTGTTALFLAKYFAGLKQTYNVMTCACVGDVAYLRKQFSQLSTDKNDWPVILPTNKKYHFGKLYQEHYELWERLKTETNIEFDLLYDPIGWRSLISYLVSNPHNKNVIYIHQGGLLGNESMLARYRRQKTQRC